MGPIINVPLEPDVRRVVLFDLDGTLIESTKARRKGWESAYPALSKLVPLSLTGFVEGCQAIYDSHSTVTGVVGKRGHVFEDMRQEWNTRMSYALLVASSENLPKVEDPRDIASYVEQLKAKLSPCDSETPLLKRAEEISDAHSINYAVELDDAIAAFWSTDFSNCVYDGVEELLDALRSRGIEYYIATEGYLPTQWRKIRAAKLDKKITYGQLLATSEAARLPEEMHALNRVMEWYGGRASACREAAQMQDLDAATRHKLHFSAQVNDLQVEGLRRITRLVSRMKKKVTYDRANHVQPEFFVRVIHAVKQSQTNPALKLETFNLDWGEGAKLRLAMVGDRAPSDVEPIIWLSGKIGEIMPIWVRQGRYRDTPPSGGKYIKCESIKEAGAKYLLSDEAWIARTTFLVKPQGLFQSALEPSISSTDERSKQRAEQLSDNVIQLLAGVAAVNSHILPDRAEPKKAREFVEKVLADIVTDVRHSQSRSEVVGTLADVVGDGLRTIALLRGCEGLKETAAKLLLAIGVEDANIDAIEGANSDVEYTALDAVFSLLQKPEEAGAVIEMLHNDQSAIDRICKSDRLAPRYRDALLGYLASPGVTSGISHVAAMELYNQIRSSVGALGKPLTRPPEPKAAAIVLGVRGPSPHPPQQSIRLGMNGEREVRCLLGGGNGRNIVAICGSPGSGKSNTLEVLVDGALKGTGTGTTPAHASAVIVFHHSLGGKCALVDTAVRLGVKANVFALESQIANVSLEYTNSSVGVKPLQFLLEELQVEVLLKWMEFSDRDAPAKEFSTILGGIKDPNELNYIHLKSAIENKRGLNPRLKQRILQGAAKLQPILTRGQSFLHEIKAGELTVIDSGRGHSSGARLRAWDTVLSVLEKHWDSTRSVETLLVFDEFHQIFTSGRDPAARHFIRHLDNLSRMGRHQQASIVAASQRPEDFKNSNDLWAGASVVLVHQLGEEVGAVPRGPNWDGAIGNPGLVQLTRGEAWYYSGDAFGKVQVRRVDASDARPRNP
jgi:FMN phosphatase YigB (HAD superfamily)